MKKVVAGVLTMILAVGVSCAAQTSGAEAWQARGDLSHWHSEGTLDLTGKWQRTHLMSLSADKITDKIHTKVDNMSDKVYRSTQNIQFMINQTGPFITLHHEFKTIGSSPISSIGQDSKGAKKVIGKIQATWYTCAINYSGDSVLCTSGGAAEGKYNKVLMGHIKDQDHIEFVGIRYGKTAQHWMLERIVAS